MDHSPLRESPPIVFRPRRRKLDSGPWMLLAVAAGTVLLWRIPWGQQALWPFTLLATWYHEMGHALTARLLGGEVLGLHIFADGSGLAIHRGAGWGRVGQALVAAGGPVAPSLAGGLMIVCSRNKKATRLCLAGLGLLLILSVLTWISWWESLAGALAIFVLGAGILFVALLGGDFLRTLTLQICGVQACIALWRDWSYFFASQAAIGGREHHSDAGVIAQALWLPHWFWGFWLTVFSLAVLLASLWIAFRPRKEKFFDALAVK